MKVCEKVQKKGVTTYNEVADELVAEFSANDTLLSPGDSVRHTANQKPSDQGFIRTTNSPIRVQDAQVLYSPMGPSQN